MMLWGLSQASGSFLCFGKDVDGFRWIEALGKHKSWCVWHVYGIYSLHRGGGEVMVTSPPLPSCNTACPGPAGEASCVLRP